MGVDYRALVPRTPPEGLIGWAVDRCRDELARSGLVYEMEYVRDYGLLQMLDEWAPPRKVKMVRVTCSCCGESTLLNWARDAAHGYGFVHPDEEEGDWAHAVTADGDETVCPMCRGHVLVKKRAAIRDYYVPAQCHVMSAGVLEAGEFVLTAWTIQARVYRSGSERLTAIPTEAYVFTAADCFQLMGWRKGYSGKCGYFTQYGPWRQPKGWRECWGWEEDIFGLTPELIDRGCLPHCKLDAYMARRPGAKHYPVAYLRLYQAHPNVEAVLLRGLPRVLDGLIASKTEAAGWEKNNRGRLELPELDWSQTRPAQILHLTKEELRMGRGQDWEKLFWDLFVGTKAIGELLSAEDIRNAFYLGDEHLSMLIPRRQVGKSIRYLLRQCEVLASEVDDAAAAPIPDAQILTDYWDMSERLGRDLAEPAVKYPADLIAAHDRASKLVAEKALGGMAEQFRIRRRVLRRFAYTAHGLLIRPAASQWKLTAEGDALDHCVGSYGKRHAEGETAIFFIRRTACQGKPYYTLELDEKELKVRQNRGRTTANAHWRSWRLKKNGWPGSEPGRPGAGMESRSGQMLPARSWVGKGRRHDQPANRRLPHLPAGL